MADHIGRVQGHPIYALAVMFAAFTGLRAGELAGLNVGDLTLPQVLGSAGSVNVTRTRRAVRGGWETSTPKSAKSRRVVPMMRGWSTICAHFWPTIIRTAARRTPTMSRLRRCFPAATGSLSRCRKGFSRDEIEPVRPMVADPIARVSRKTGEPDRRYVKADPHAATIRVARSDGYRWSVSVNPAGIAKHYLTPALAALGLAGALALSAARVRGYEFERGGALHGGVEDARARLVRDHIDGLRGLHHRMRRREGRAGGASGRVDRAERGPNASAAAG